MRILAIETSCDETAAAVVEDGRTILSSVVATQIELHRRFGGIFPEVASRQHVLAIGPVVEEALAAAGVTELTALDAVAVTQGPGLAGSLLVGVNLAKGISFASGLPLIGVNHLEGHVYSGWLRTPDAVGSIAGDEFPTLVLIVSGGHTELILMEGHGCYRHLGGTLDDAAGEAFDKVGRLLGLGFPGGPAIEAAAAPGDPMRFALPRALRGQGEHRFDFSFSGLKTAVLNLTRSQATEMEGDQGWRADMAASFQRAVVDILLEKSADAALAHGARQVCICGGVSANRSLRQAAGERYAAMGLPLVIPPLHLCTDNAAMIGAAAYFRSQYAPIGRNTLSLDVAANLPLAAR